MENNSKCQIGQTQDVSGSVARTSEMTSALGSAELSTTSSSTVSQALASFPSPELEKRSKELAISEAETFAPQLLWPPSIINKPLLMHDAKLYPFLWSLKHMDTCLSMAIFQLGHLMIYITTHEGGVVRMQHQPISNPGIVYFSELDCLRNKKLVAAGGSNPFFLLTDDHEMYCFGNNDRQLIVFSHEVTMCRNPQFTLSNVVQADFSRAGGVVIDDDGMMWTNGGIFGEARSHHAWRPHPHLGTIVSVCLKDHLWNAGSLLFLDQDGVMRVWSRHRAEPFDIPQAVSHQVVQCTLIGNLETTAILILFATGRLSLLTDYENENGIPIKHREICCRMPNGNVNRFKTFVKIPLSNNEFELQTVVATTYLGDNWVLKFCFGRGRPLQIMSFKSQCKTACDAFYVHQDKHYYRVEEEGNLLFVSCPLVPRLMHLTTHFRNQLIGIQRRSQHLRMDLRWMWTTRNLSLLVDQEITFLNVIRNVYATNDLTTETQVSIELITFLLGQGLYTWNHLARMIKYAGWRIDVNHQVERQQVVSRVDSLKVLVLRFLAYYQPVHDVDIFNPHN